YWKLWRRLTGNTSGDLVETMEEIMQYIALLPSSCAAWVFYESKKLLFPEEDKMKILQDWPDYWKWRIHFNVALMYSLFFAIVGLLAWVLDFKVMDSTGFIMLVSSVIGGLVVIISVYMARVTQGEILISVNSSNNFKSKI
ncbi:MAG: hypothetical protein RQ824_10010, partial [bacterium]|nr:hypothetical protein [bacterium]